jgi:hypothetical protein
VYVHVPKDRSKLYPSGKKGVFVVYSETLKAYRVYISGYRQIEISRDVTFDEDVAFSRSRQHHTNEIHDEEPEATRVLDSDVGNDVVLEEHGPDEHGPEEHGPEDHDMAEPQRHAKMITKKRRPTWACEIIQDVEKYGAPYEYLREGKKPRPYCNYVTFLCDIIDVEPTCYEEAARNKVWKDAMIEEYRSIIKNDVWDVFLRPKEKLVVSSKWIYKTKHSTYGNIEKYKARFMARGFSQKEGIYYEETFSPMARYTYIRDILVIVVEMKWKVHQMDVKLAFLNSVVDS